MQIRFEETQWMKVFFFFKKKHFRRAAILRNIKLIYYQAECKSQNLNSYTQINHEQKSTLTKTKTTNKVQYIHTKKKSNKMSIGRFYSPNLQFTELPQCIQ